MYFQHNNNKKKFNLKKERREGVRKGRETAKELSTMLFIFPANNLVHWQINMLPNDLDFNMVKCL
jgi:hypothetical protein